MQPNHLLDDLKFSFQSNYSQQFPTNFAQKKSQKKHNQIRAGDWICNMCNNLNYSFRNVCNRCKVQTKRNNYIQNLMMMQETDDQQFEFQQSQPQNRGALQDITDSFPKDVSNIQQMNFAMSKPYYPQKMVQQQKQQGYWSH